MSTSLVVFRYLSSELNRPKFFRSQMRVDKSASGIPVPDVRWAHQS